MVKYKPDKPRKMFSYRGGFRGSHEDEPDDQDNSSQYWMDPERAANARRNRIFLPRVHSEKHVARHHKTHEQRAARDDDDDRGERAGRDDDNGGEREERRASAKQVMSQGFLDYVEQSWPEMNDLLETGGRFYEQERGGTHFAESADRIRQAYEHLTGITFKFLSTYVSNTDTEASSGFAAALMRHLRIRIGQSYLTPGTLLDEEEAEKGHRRQHGPVRGVVKQCANSNTKNKFVQTQEGLKTMARENLERMGYKACARFTEKSPGSSRARYHVSISE